MTIFPPEGLELDAIVPHSLDGEFIADDLLRKMVRGGNDFNTPAIRIKRTRSGTRELMRSLLYARQVVINRAFFVNTPYLFEHYETDSQAREFIKLMETGAVIPFVTEKGFPAINKVDFEQHERGAKALEALARHIPHPRTVSIPHGAATENPLVALGMHFTKLLAGLGDLNMEARGLVLQALGVRIKSRKQPNPALDDQFQLLLNRLAQLALEKIENSPNKTLTRDEIYKAFFCVREPHKNPVANGIFLPELPSNPALLLVKKLVDTLYNFNLPDHLGCSSLTIPGSAGRTLMDLVRHLTGEKSPSESTAQPMNTEWERIIEKARLINANVAQNSVEIPLPCLEKLTALDIYTIQNKSYWKKFIQIKHTLIETPSADNLVEVFDEFVRRHEELHLAIARERTRPFPIEGVTRIEHCIPFMKLASPIAGIFGASLGATEAVDLGMEIPGALAFTIQSVNKTRPQLMTALAFRSIRTFHYTSREQLRELSNLRKTAQPTDNGRVEQSKA